MTAPTERERLAGERAIAGAFAELRNGDLRQATAARKWITGGSAELAFAAALAGLRANTVRSWGEAVATGSRPGAAPMLLRRLRALQSDGVY
ncbi:hypothetical protein CLV78_105205 [Aliiruegeria haliotis]|uniref:Uncharacterized protein n=1 Tax=Aliiruegeria haliotis TaxID=1280846 RepID=A0A2T0RPR9_9RHOB|nr:hypothetical protein [Aliiruegeria haliotis]PRY23151.1 hypothetical protein CLV78_105205 [Aliiruegeria haliotis]